MFAGQCWYGVVFVHGEHRLVLDLHSIFPNAVLTFHFPLIPKDGIDEIGEQYEQSQRPDKGDCVEEVGIAAPSCDPEMVKGGSEQSGVHQRGTSSKGMAVC